MTVSEFLSMCTYPEYLNVEVVDENENLLHDGYHGPVPEELQSKTVQSFVIYSHNEIGLVVK